MPRLQCLVPCTCPAQQAWAVCETWRMYAVQCVDCKACSFYHNSAREHTLQTTKQQRSQLVRVADSCSPTGPLPQMAMVSVCVKVQGQTDSVRDSQLCCCGTCCFAHARVSMTSTLCCLLPCISDALAAALSCRFATADFGAAAGEVAALPPFLPLLPLPLAPTSVSRASPPAVTVTAAAFASAGAAAVTMALPWVRRLARGSCS